MHPSELSGELLTRHSAFLRSLARGLLGDEELAEDACQEALLATLRRPPPPRVNLAAWLATLTRRAALGMHRSAKRREHREASVARSEAHPAETDALAHAELLVRVAEAVRALDEPYRATLLARYYEDLVPAAIAARDGVPLATVKSRLTRAHALLRERLDRSLGDPDAWRAELAAVCGFPAKSLLVPVLAMKTSVKLGLAAAAVLALASAGWLALDARRERASPVAREPALIAAVAPQLESLPASAPGAERAAVAKVAAQSAAPLLLWGEIHGPTAKELEDCELTVFDELGKSRKASIGTPPSYSMFGLTPGSFRLVSQLRGFLPLDEPLVLQGGESKVRHDVELRRSFVLPVKFIDVATGESWKNLDSPSDPIGQCLSVAATRTQPVQIGSELGRRVFRSEAGFYHTRNVVNENPLVPEDANGALEVIAPTPLFASLVLRDLVLETRALRGNETELKFLVDRTALEKRLSAIELRCVERDTGQPIPDQSVGVEFRDSTGGGSGSTDAQGSARIERLTPGMRLVVLRSRSFATLERWVRLEPGQTLDLGTLELDTPAKISGHVRDANGAGVSAPLSVLTLSRATTPRGAASRMQYRSKADGAFEITWAESAPVRLIAEPADRALAVLDVDATSGRVENVELALEPGIEVSVRAPAASAFAEFLLSDERGAPLLLSAATHLRPRKLLLRPGHYAVSIVVDDRVASTQRFDVASEPVSVDLR